MSPKSQRFDYRVVRNRFNRAATTYDQHAAIQQEVARRLDERFEWLQIEPGRILDLGSGTGQLVRLMRKRFPAAQVVALDLAEEMLLQVPKVGRLRRRRSAVCADMHALPFASGSFDVVVSSFSLQWSTELDRVFAEVARVLSAGGAFAFSTLGPDSLKECRQAWAQVDSEVHVHAFPDMHDIGDALVHACLADPVMDREELVASYPSARALLRDLRGVGVGNAAMGRSEGMTGRDRWRRFQVALEQVAGDEGQVPLSYEVVYGLAWGTGVAPLKISGSYAPNKP